MECRYGSFEGSKVSDRIKRIVFNPIGWIIGGLIGIIVVYYIVSLQMPIKVLKEGDNPKIAFSGEPYQICKNVEYLRDATIVIDRALLKNLDNGDTININLASVTITREEGKHQVCRLILLPLYMEEGKWIINTFYTWEYGIWKHTAKTKDIDIVVVDNQRR